MEFFCFFFFKQKTAYAIRIRDWSADVGSSDLHARIAYGSSKGAIIAMSKYVATQYGHQGIRSNTIAPGVIMTQALERTVPGLKEMIARHVLTPRFGTPDDIAALVAFLASDESGYITGETISISGGSLIHQPHYADLFAAMGLGDRKS